MVPLDEQGLWSVAGDYDIKDGYLLANGQPGRAYTPASAPQVVRDFARLARQPLFLTGRGNDSNEAAVREFARQWGVVGYGNLLAAKYPDRMPPGGEPLQWIWAHASGVDICMRLLHYLQSEHREATERLGSYLGSLRMAVPEGHPVQDFLSESTARWVCIPFGNREIVDQIVVSHSNPDTLARLIVQAILSPNLSGMRPELRAVDATAPATPLPSPIPADAAIGLAMRLGFTALLEAIYWHVAQIALGHDRVARCIECGSYFKQNDRRQKYCPPRDVEGYAGRAQSPCGRRSRSHTSTRGGTTHA